MSKHMVWWALMENHERCLKERVDVGYDPTRDTFEDDVRKRMANMRAAVASLNQAADAVSRIIANAMGEVPKKNPTNSFPENPGHDMIVWYGFRNHTGPTEDSWSLVRFDEGLGRILGFSADPPPDEVVRALATWLAFRYDGLVWLTDHPYYEDDDETSPREIRICWPTD